MTDKIEVGEYVRTRKGYIAKVKQIICKGYPIKELEGHIICDDEDRTILNPNEVNHSKNIIDLIQVGDYVNGSYVVDILEDMQIGELHLEMTYNYTNQEKGDCTIYNKDIKEILTKEQFNQNSYKVVE